MGKRWLTCLLAIITMGGFASAPAQEPDPAELLKAADEMIQITARIRGLEPKAPIAKGVKTRAEISQYVNEQVQESYPKSRLQQEEKLLRALGFISPTLDYRDLIIKLYTEQIGGLYDPEKKTFYIASWLPPEDQKPVMVHELAHALQDQYFDVKKILKDNRNQNNDDRGLAQQALLEGDGMVVMLNYLLEPAKRNFSQLPDLSFVMQTLMGSLQQSQFAVFGGAPAFIKETMMFPYGYGASFLQKIWLRNPSWDAVNKIYSDPPVSTEQIIHPEKYYGTRDEPKPANAEELAARLSPSWKVAYKNVLGEFSLNLLLSLHVSEERAKRCAAGWGGDQVLLLENAAGRNAVLVSTVWDAPSEAEEFFQAMQVWLRQKFPNARKTDETPDGFSLVQDGEVHWLRHDGAAVRFMLNLPETDAVKFALNDQR